MFNFLALLDIRVFDRLQLVLDGINILLPVYGITNSKRYLVFHGILIKHN